MSVFLPWFLDSFFCSRWTCIVLFWESLQLWSSLVDIGECQGSEGAFCSANAWQINAALPSMSICCSLLSVTIADILIGSINYHLKWLHLMWICWRALSFSGLVGELLQEGHWQYWTVLIRLWLPNLIWHKYTGAMLCSPMIGSGLSSCQITRKRNEKRNGSK